jgi:hypothetical protein
MDICKFYINGTCKKGTECKFQHVDNICTTFYFQGSCTEQNCLKTHGITNKKQFKSKNTQQTTYEQTSPNAIQKNTNNVKRDQRGNRNKKNTESFVPSDKPTDMNLLFHHVSISSDTIYPFTYQSRDVFVVSNLFQDMGDVYSKILQEINKNDNGSLWKLWHGDSHLIADDHMKWKSTSPTFTEVIRRLETYFSVQTKATRLNLYRDSSDWKPYHHDAAAIDADKAKTQNVTIGVTFGSTRSASFEHATTKTTVSMPLQNGMVYGFGPQLNIEWRHGILQEKEVSQQGRISIILWGWVQMQ